MSRDSSTEKSANRSYLIFKPDVSVITREEKDS